MDERTDRTRRPASGHGERALVVIDTSDPDGLAAMKEKFDEAFGAAGFSGKETVVLYENAMNTGFGQSCRGYPKP